MQDIIINIITLFCGGGLGWLLNWRANRRKANGEATQTEADAMKSVQDVYQQTLADQQTYIDKLKVSRDHLISTNTDLRTENDDLRKRINEVDEKMRQLEDEVARNRQMMAATRMWMCGRMNCQQRITADINIDKN